MTLAALDFHPSPFFHDELSEQFTTKFYKKHTKRTTKTPKNEA